MKTVFKNMILTFVLSLSMVFAMGQDFATISNHLKSGNASGLAQNFADNVDVIALNTDGSYSKSQAEMVLKNFFSNNTPQSYTSVHNGDSGSGSFQIGELITSSGTYRTYIFVKNDKIVEIRIEKD
ncbi:MAG: DUF4783 domain-containing protein [Chitinophagales bacterium]